MQESNGYIEILKNNKDIDSIIWNLELIAKMIIDDYKYIYIFIDIFNENISKDVNIETLAAIADYEIAIIDKDLIKIIKQFMTSSDRDYVFFASYAFGVGNIHESNTVLQELKRKKKRNDLENISIRAIEKAHDLFSGRRELVNINQPCGSMAYQHGQ